MGAGSFIANSVKRRESLQKTRRALLDGPGTTRRGGPPPPVVPAQDKKSPQQKALRKPQPAPQSQVSQKPQTEPVSAAQTNEPSSPLGLDDETREGFLNAIRPLLDKERARQRSKLHKTVGRARRFFGGGF